MVKPARWPSASLFMPAFYAALISLMFALLGGCSSASSGYYYAQMLADRGNLDFQDSLKVDEYLNAFDQDWLEVPKGEEVVLRVDALSDGSIAAGENALYQVAVKTRRPVDAELRQPMALSLVMDVSGSMTGEKISDLKAALKNAVLELRDGDKVSLVTFNHEAKVLASALTISSQSRAQIATLVDAIVAGGGTNIEVGLVSGYQEMSKLSDVSARRLLLLTDGISSVGSVSPQQIAARARVGFIEGARISTIGLGIDVDQDVLRAIAAQGNGHYYFADNSKTLTGILREGLATTVIPVASNVQLTIALDAEYEFVRLFGGEMNDGKSNAGEQETADSLTNSHERQVSLGELNARDWRILIAEVRRVKSEDAVMKNDAGSENDASGEIDANGVMDGKDVIRVSGRYQSVASTNVVALPPVAHTQTTPPESANGINPNVLRNATLYANAQALIEVGTLSRDNNYDDALRVLDLQINNNRILETYDTSAMVANERETLESVRQTVVLRKDFHEGKAAPEKGFIDDRDAMSQAQRRSPLPPSNLRTLVLGGLDLVSGAPNGTWATLANILGAAIR